MFAQFSVFSVITALGAIMGRKAFISLLIRNVTLPPLPTYLLGSNLHVLAQTSTSFQTTCTVVQGDNCVALAAKFNVTDAALLAANPVRPNFV